MSTAGATSHGNLDSSARDWGAAADRRVRPELLTRIHLFVQKVSSPELNANEEKLET